MQINNYNYRLDRRIPALQGKRSLWEGKWIKGKYLIQASIFG